MLEGAPFSTYTYIKTKKLLYSEEDFHNGKRKIRPLQAAC
jgi:hypothetical protein